LFALLHTANKTLLRKAKTTLLIMLLSAANSFTSGISASPLGQRGPKKDYNIDAAIADWMSDVRIQGRLNTFCKTIREWENWAQVEFSMAFRDAFTITTDIREPPGVFKEQQTADFVLPETDEFKGMIIKLKCENQDAHRGNAMQKLVDEDMQKRYDVKPEYKDYTFVALAMTFTTEAQEALTEIGMSSIPQAASSVDQGAVRVYKKIFPLLGLTKGMEDLNQAPRGLFSYGSEL
jgi:hypothetical protein